METNTQSSFNFMREKLIYEKVQNQSYEIEKEMKKLVIESLE